MDQPTSTASPKTSVMPPEQHSQQVEAHCQEHGAYRATRVQHAIFDQVLIHESPCPKCTARTKAEREAREISVAAMERSRRADSLALKSGIPARFADKTFDGYDATTPAQRVVAGVCRAYAENWPEKLRSGASLVLTGGPGTGKTHLACAIGSHVIREHLGTVAFGTVSTILRAIKETYRRESERTERDVIAELTGLDLLIVDEVGIQTGSEHEKLLMFEILNARYQDLRPTILITNLTLPETEQFLGQRVMDRYRECGAVLAFDWASRRGTR